MMARTHVAMGAAVWVGVAQTVNSLNTPGELLAGAVVGGGAALLPDLDHRSGTAAKTWGPITKSLGYAVGRLSGGHRQGTHTLMAAVLVGTAVHAVLLARSFLAIVVLGLLVGLAVVAWEALLPGRWERLWPANVAVSLAAGWLLVSSGIGFEGWLPAAVMVGWLAHILGDAVTTGGVRMFMPFSNRRVRLTGLRTGGLWEVVAQWMFSVATVGLLMAGAR